MHKATMKSIANQYKSGVKIPRLATERGISIEMTVAALVDSDLVRIGRFNQVVGRAKSQERKRVKNG